MSKKNKCELLHCASDKNDTRIIHINENIEDQSYRTAICRTCADALELKSGDDLPDDGNKVNKILKEYRAARSGMQSSKVQKLKIVQNET